MSNDAKEKCSVCGCAINESEHVARVNGRDVRVCCAEYAQALERDPASYAGRS